jgi:hypothetical protein
MGRFKIGDKVTSNGTTFAADGRVGTIVRVNSDGFLVYNVQYPGDSDVYEYHAGELKSLGGKYEVIFDVNGKPTSEFASNEEQLRKLLKKGFNKSLGDDTFDIAVYSGNQNITESQMVNEIVADLMDK